MVAICLQLAEELFFSRIQEDDKNLKKIHKRKKKKIIAFKKNRQSKYFWYIFNMYIENRKFHGEIPRREKAKLYILYINAMYKQT